MLRRWKIHRLRIIVFPFWNVVMGVSNLCTEIRYKWQLMPQGIRTIFYGRRTLRLPKIGPDKKKKLGFQHFFFFSSDNVKSLFFISSYRFGKKNLQTYSNVGGKNKKNAWMSFFFLVGNNFGSLEDSSTIKCTEHGLTEFILTVLITIK